MTENVIANAPDLAAQPTAGDNRPIFTVSEISQALKRSVEENFSHVRVKGELTSVKRAGSGHVYLCLKDENAVLDGVVWRQTAQRLRMEPEDGMEVIASTKITSLMKAFSLNPEDASLMERMRAVLGLLKRIPVELDLWEAQNFYFSVARRLYKYKKKMAGKDDASGQWLEQFRDLGRNLKVRVE